jgi:hypothetical protein
VGLEATCLTAFQSFPSPEATLCSPSTAAVEMRRRRCAITWQVLSAVTCRMAAASAAHRVP